MLENAKKRSRRPHGDARNAKRSLAGPPRQRPLPAEDRMRCGGMKEKESSLSLCSLRARASAPPPTASAMRSVAWEQWWLIERSRERRRPTQLFFAFFPLRCGGVAVVWHPQSCLLLARERLFQFTHPSLCPLQTPIKTPSPPSHRPAHAGLAGHGLEDGDRDLRGL